MKGTSPRRAACEAIQWTTGAAGMDEAHTDDILLPNEPATHRNRRPNPYAPPTTATLPTFTESMMEGQVHCS